MMTLSGGQAHKAVEVLTWRGVAEEVWSLASQPYAAVRPHTKFLRRPLENGYRAVQNKRLRGCEWRRKSSAGRQHRVCGVTPPSTCNSIQIIKYHNERKCNTTLYFHNCTSSLCIGTYRSYNQSLVRNLGGWDCLEDRNRFSKKVTYQ
jgi:hypothetical protein